MDFRCLVTIAAQGCVLCACNGLNGKDSWSAFRISMRGEQKVRPGTPPPKKKKDPPKKLKHKTKIHRGSFAKNLSHSEFGPSTLVATWALEIRSTKCSALGRSQLKILYCACWRRRGMSDLPRSLREGMGEG